MESKFFERFEKFRFWGVIFFQLWVKFLGAKFEKMFGRISFVLAPRFVPDPVQYVHEGGELASVYRQDGASTSREF